MNRRRLLAAAPEVLAWSGLALSLLVLFLRLGGAKPSELHDWVSSDTLGGVSFVVDILRDRFPVSGWRFPIAPFCVPDLFLAALFWEATRNPMAAMLLAGFSQVALIVGGLLLIRNAVGLGERRLQAVLTLGAAAGITLYAAFHIDVPLPDYYLLFTPENHVGNLINSLYALGLALVLVRGEMERGWARRGLYLAYAAVCFAAGMSNLIFLAEMLVPLAAALLAAGFLGFIPWKCCWTTPALGFPSALAGGAVARMSLHTAPLSQQSHLSVGAFLVATNVFLSGAAHQLAAGEFLHIVAVAWISLCAFAGAWLIRKLAFHGSAALGTGARLAFLFVTSIALSGLVCVASLLIGGNSGLTTFHAYVWTLHYLPMLLFLPLFVVPMLAAWSIPRRLEGKVQDGLALVFAAGVFSAPVVSLAQTRMPSHQITSYHPPLVALLDDLAPRLRLREGLAGYWDARLITLLTWQGVRANAVDREMNPFLWLANSAWYTESFEDRRKPPPVDFVVMANPVTAAQRSVVLTRFGESRDEVKSSDYDVFIFRWPDGRPGDENQPLTDFSQFISSRVTHIQVRPGERFTIPLTLKNTGNVVWRGSGRFPVHLGYLWMVPGSSLRIEGRGPALPVIEPGHEIEVSLNAVAPREAAKSPDGKVMLRIGMLQEHIAWFYEHGAAALDVPVDVRSRMVPAVSHLPRGTV